MKPIEVCSHTTLLENGIRFLVSEISALNVIFSTADDNFLSLIEGENDKNKVHILSLVHGLPLCFVRRSCEADSPRFVWRLKQVERLAC